MFFDHKGSVKRLSLDESDSDKESFAQNTALQGFPIQVQPANNETVALSNGVYGKTYNVFTTTSGILDGDRLTVSGTFVDNLSQNKELQVMNVNNWYFQPLPHFVITCGEIEE